MNQIKELAVRMHELNQRKDDIKSLLAGINKELDAIRFSALPDAMDSEGIARVAIKGVGTVSLYPDVRASIRASTREEAWNWLKENGFSDLLMTTVNSSTLKAWAKEQLNEGVEIPDDLFSIAPYTYAKITK